MALSFLQMNEFIDKYSRFIGENNEDLKKRLYQILLRAFSSLSGILDKIEKEQTHKEQIHFELLADEIKNCFLALYSCRQAGIDSLFPTIPTPEQANEIILHPQIYTVVEDAGVNVNDFLQAPGGTPITWLRINISSDIKNNRISPNFSLEYVYWSLYSKLVIFLWKLSFPTSSKRDENTFAYKFLKCYRDSLPRVEDPCIQPYYQPLATIFEELIMEDNVSLNTFQDLVAISKSFYYDAMLGLNFKTNKIKSLFDCTFVTTVQEFYLKKSRSTGIMIVQQANQTIKTFLKLYLPFLKKGEKNQMMTVCLIRSLFQLFGFYLRVLQHICDDIVIEGDDEKLFWMWNKINRLKTEEKHE